MHFLKFNSFVLLDRPTWHPEVSFSTEGQPAMGGFSSKTSFFGRRKKQSTMSRAWKGLKGALPHKKRKKRNILSLDRLSLDNLKREQRRFSLPTNQKERIPMKRFSLGEIKKEPQSIQMLSLGRRERERGRGGAGDPMKRKQSTKNTRKDSKPNKRFSLSP